MISAVKSRKGMTLAEIMVSLALVAIIITMTASFVALITERTRVNRENETLREDRALIQSGVESWITSMLSDGYSIMTSEESPSLFVSIEEVSSYVLSFDNNELTGTRPGGEKIELSTEKVTGISFSITSKTENEITKKIYFCTVNPGEETEYTFCVYPRIGEAVNG